MRMEMRTRTAMVLAKNRRTRVKNEKVGQMQRTIVTTTGLDNGEGVTR
jgi:septum formation topological specificity factor MinE